MISEKVSLGNLQETMLMPLWGRAVEMQKDNPLLIDTKAKKIVEDLHYDFSTIEKNINPLARAAWIARSIYFDREISDFQMAHPDCSIINVGCGLDTTYDRVYKNNSKWYEMDLPDVIQLRRKFISENNERVFIAGSILEDFWYSRIQPTQNVLFLFAGILYYFEENQVKLLFKKLTHHFNIVNILFDFCSRNGLEISNKEVIDKGGMNKDASLKWSIEDIHELETWGMRLNILNTMPMFEEYKNNFTPEKRTGMNISDNMKIMSLAHIELSNA